MINPQAEAARIAALPWPTAGVSERTLQALDADLRRRGYTGLTKEDRAVLSSPSEEAFGMLEDWSDRLDIDVAQATQELRDAADWTPPESSRSAAAVC